MLAGFSYSFGQKLNFCTEECLNNINFPKKITPHTHTSVLNVYVADETKLASVSEFPLLSWRLERI